jgi:hypothetical protein
MAFLYFNVIAAAIFHPLLQEHQLIFSTNTFGFMEILHDSV